MLVRFSRMPVFLSLVGLLATCTSLGAQPAAPTPPAKFQATLRYRITSSRDLHVMQYDALIEDLKALGFEFQPPLEKRPRTDREDPSKNTLQGIIPSGNVTRVFHNPNVVSMLLIPQEFKLPEDPNQRVQVRLEIAGGLHRERQRELV